MLWSSQLRNDQAAALQQENGLAPGTSLWSFERRKLVSVGMAWGVKLGERVPALITHAQPIPSAASPPTKRCFCARLAENAALSAQKVPAETSTGGRAHLSLPPRFTPRAAFV